MGMAALPADHQPGLSEEELASFLAEHGLTPVDGAAPLAVRAAKLKAAIDNNAELVNPSRSAEDRRQAL